MALQGPFAVVADSPAPDVVEALRAAGAFPIIETTWADAPTALASVEPEAVVLAEPCPRSRARRRRSPTLLAEQRQEAGGLFMPVIARTRDDGAPSIPDALAIAANAPPQRLVRRLADGAAHPHAARHCAAPHAHARLARRTAAGTAGRPIRSTKPPCWSPAAAAPIRRLSVAVGERVGLVGALCVESAARALNARDIDGIVIGDGFGPRIVEALLTVLAEDVRFRDLPVAVLGGPPASIEPSARSLPNLERIAEGPQRLVERFLPLCARCTPSASGSSACSNRSTPRA